MSEIVDRLRSVTDLQRETERSSYEQDDQLALEAADTITRLTAEVERLTVEAQISYAEGFHDGDENGSKIKREFLEKLEAENEKLKRQVAENERLRAALGKLIRACHEGRIVQRSAGGMTIEAQTKNSVINGVSAWAVCEAEEVLDTPPDTGEQHMTTPNLREKIARAIEESLYGTDRIGRTDTLQYGLEADAAIAIVLEEAAKVANSYEPRCDTCPSGVTAAIRALKEKKNG